MDQNNVIIIRMHEKMIQMYKDLLLTYMDKNYIHLTNINEIRRDYEDKFIAIDNIYLGVDVLQLIETINQPELVKYFRKKCRDFLIVACEGITKRYDFDNKLLAIISALSVKKALRKEERTFPYPIGKSNAESYFKQHKFANSRRSVEKTTPGSTAYGHDQQQRTRYILAPS